jgi:hypothetical protein
LDFLLNEEHWSDASFSAHPVSPNQPSVCGGPWQGGRTASDIVTHADNRLQATAKPHAVVELTGPAAMEQSCAGKQLCLLAVLPDILDSGVAGARPYQRLIKPCCEPWCSLSHCDDFRTCDRREGGSSPHYVFSFVGYDAGAGLKLSLWRASISAVRLCSPLELSSPLCGPRGAVSHGSVVRAGRNAYLDTMRALGEQYKSRPWGLVWAAAGSQPQLEAALDIGGAGYPAFVRSYPLSRTVIWFEASRTNVDSGGS